MSHMGWSQICMYVSYLVALVIFVITLWPQKDFPKKPTNVIRRRGSFRDR